MARQCGPKSSSRGSTKRHSKMRGGFNWDPLGVGQKAKDWAWHVQQDTKDLPTFVNSVKREQSDPNSWSHQAVNAAKSVVPGMSDYAKAVGYGKRKAPKRKAHHKLRGGFNWDPLGVGQKAKDWAWHVQQDTKDLPTFVNSVKREQSDPNSWSHQAVNAAKSVVPGMSDYAKAVGYGRPKRVGRPHPTLRKGSAAAKAHMARLRAMRR